MSYHAPSAFQGASVALGQMGNVVANSQNYNNGWRMFDPVLNGVPAGTIICGDFNVDYVSSPNLYTALPLNAAVQKMATSLTLLAQGGTRTTPVLEPTDPQKYATTTATFLVNAFDNVLYAGQVALTQNSLLVDTIYLASNQPYNYPVPAGQSQAQWQATLSMFSRFTIALRTTGIKQTLCIAPNAAALTLYQSFVLYRYVISDHMPVMAFLTLA